MKFEEVKYIVVSKDEKTWMRLNRSRYGSKLAFTKIETEKYTFSPEKYDTIEDAREALTNYLLGAKTKRATDFKIMKMRFTSESVDEIETLPSECKMHLWSFGVVNPKNSKEYKDKVKANLEKNYKIPVISFDCVFEKEIIPPYTYSIDVANLTNIVWDTETSEKGASKK